MSLNIVFILQQIVKIPAHDHPSFLYKLAEVLPDTEALDSRKMGLIYVFLFFI
jgi:hypothetical protein